MRPIVYEELKVGDKVVTRDGREGRVICTDANIKDGSAHRPIICLIKNKNETEEILSFKKCGAHSSIEGNTYAEDIFLPPKKELLNLYQWSNGSYFLVYGDAVVTIPKEYETISCKFIKTIEVEL